MLLLDCITMNQQDRKEFEIVHLKIDDMRQDLIELKKRDVRSHIRRVMSLLVL